MSNPNNKNRRRQFKAEEKAILEILNEWEPIGFPTPCDEYDCLAHQLIHFLHSNCSLEEIVMNISNEIHNHFCLEDISFNEIESVAEKIWLWWQTKS